MSNPRPRLSGDSDSKVAAGGGGVTWWSSDLVSKRNRIARSFWLSPGWCEAAEQGGGGERWGGILRYFFVSGRRSTVSGAKRSHPVHATLNVTVVCLFLVSYSEARCVDMAGR